LKGYWKKFYAGIEQHNSREVRFAEVEAEENLGNLLDRVVKVDRHENQATPASLCIARISRLFWTSPGQKQVGLLQACRGGFFGVAAVASSEITQTFLKPGFLRPMPILYRKPISLIGAKDELP